MPPRIAIVGGGPAGLCLAALLHHRGIPLTLYELRQRPPASAVSTPCSMLDLHHETGLAAVRACGLWERLAPLTTACAESTIIRRPNGSVTYHDGGNASYRPEVSRAALVDLLLWATAEGSIRWGSKVCGVRQRGDGTVALQVSRGEGGEADESQSSSSRDEEGWSRDDERRSSRDEEQWSRDKRRKSSKDETEYDVVIGADGAWSRVRSLVTPVKPHYGGVCYTTLRIAQAEQRYPHLSALVGPGTCCILGNERVLSSHRSIAGSIVLHASTASATEASICDASRGLSTAQMEELMLHDARFFGGWGCPLVRQLLATAIASQAQLPPFEPPVFKPMYMLPVGHAWPANQASATLIGDAAHLMMPWAGEGVNLALRDALDLADALDGAWGETRGGQQDGGLFREALRPRLARFEEAMFARAAQAAHETWQNSGIFFGRDSARRLGDLMAGFTAQGQGER
ncbi:hypothetical protein CDD81_4751 [Ophiocordyceps australis]|uniref:FAD-binding domain-containing protein n=1 Tax=Ophiocordyceps australis TaxID=1399860 RepID=A0A2C5Y6E4_9HYPO|nr:hypothetical protein CDD81_4751 [Ophiocordyceps australis]